MGKGGGSPQVRRQCRNLHRNDDDVDPGTLLPFVLSKFPVAEMFIFLYFEHSYQRLVSMGQGFGPATPTGSGPLRVERLPATLRC